MKRRELLRSVSLAALWPLLLREPAAAPAAGPEAGEAQRIVALGPGALRLLVYLGAADRLCAVEAMEQRAPNGRPYTFMLDDRVEQLPVIGPGGVGRLPDLERLLAAAPDLAVAVTLDQQQVQMLEQRAGIPVLGLSYGAVGELQLPVFADSLRRLGVPLGRSARAETLIAAINASRAELAERVRGVEPAQVYLGGISLKGQQGLASTQAGHLPLQWAGAENLADRIAERGHLFLDREQLLAWDPPTLFIDGGGLPAVVREAAVNPGLFEALAAVRAGRVYAILPFNAYNTNVEHALANAWFIAAMLYPRRFADLDPIAKTDTLYRAFYGRPLYARLRQEQPGFARVDLLQGRVHALA